MRFFAIMLLSSAASLTVGVHGIPQVELVVVHVIPQGRVHVIPHWVGRVVAGVVLADRKLLPSREVMGAEIGEENVQRGRCDRNSGALACGPVAQ